MLQNVYKSDKYIISVVATSLKVEEKIIIVCFNFEAEFEILRTLINIFACNIQKA